MKWRHLLAAARRAGFRGAATPARPSGPPLKARPVAASLPLPETLTRLIAAGVWPSDRLAMGWQQCNPIVSEARVRRFASEESLVCLAPPPFRTIAEHMAAGAGDFWQRFGAVDQIVPSMALVVGDFGLGSDSPIVLDFARDRSDPPIYRLRWGDDRINDWIRGADNFDEFAALLGLSDRLDSDPRLSSR